jgi:PAS domain S-box-containing protein
MPVKKLRILVVEDEIIVARDIQMQLAELGYEAVGHATRGEDAVVLADTLRPDLVLMDIQLAGEVNGIEAAHAIRDKCSLPIVFLTAFASDDTIGNAKLAQPFGYILKPFSERELSTVIEIAVHKHGAEMLLQQQTAALLEINTELANQKFALDQHAIVAITDLNDTITYANDKFCAISGYTREELIGRSHRLVNSGTHPKEFFAQLWDTVRQGEVWHGEICNRAKDGSLYWVYSTLVPLLRPNGDPHAFVCIRTDVTERKQAEEARRIIQERFHAIFDHAEVGMFETTPDGCLTRVNRFLAKLLGKPAESIVGSHWEAFTHPESRHAAGAPPPVTPQEKRFLREDGSVFWGQLMSGIELDAAGQPAGNICILHDISGQVEARQTLLRFNSELEEKVNRRTRQLAARNLEIQALLQAIPDMVMRCRADGGMIHVQPAQGEGGLAALAQHAGPDFAALCPPDLLASSLELGRRALSESATVTSETEVRIAGREVAVELRAAPVGLEEFVAFVRDITERKRHEVEVEAMLEKERQISEMKTRFISVTSHEFRTPMTVVMGAVEILANHLDRLLPEKRQELFGRITSSLDRMTEMLDAILTLNRLDVNKIDARAVSIDLRYFIQDVIEEILVGDLDAHRIELIASAEEIPFVTDPQLLHHVVSNLLSNAVRYSPNGTLVSVHLEANPTGVFLSVEDRGIGIPAEDLARVFDPFERGSNIGTIKGTGLGLNIVKRMTETLGGTIGVSSVEGGGTRFEVVFQTTPGRAPRQNLSSSSPEPV